MVTIVLDSADSSSSSTTSTFSETFVDANEYFEVDRRSYLASQQHRASSFGPASRRAGDLQHTQDTDDAESELDDDQSCSDCLHTVLLDHGPAVPMVYLAALRREHGYVMTEETLRDALDACLARGHCMVRHGRIARVDTLDRCDCRSDPRGTDGDDGGDDEQ